MQKPQLGAHCLVPTDQHAPEATPPTVRPRHDPPLGPDPASCFRAVAASPRARRWAVQPNSVRSAPTESSS
jgi:hypothetical protein